MTPREAERLKSYLKLIMPKKDPERVREVAAAKAAAPAGLEVVGAAEGPGATAELVQQAQAGTETLLRGGDVPPDQLAGLEAIILPDLRPAVDIIDGKFTVTHDLWTHLSSNAAIRRRIEEAIPSIGRVELPGHRQYPYGGTGFVVGDGLVMTNRHVAAIFATGVGSRRLGFKPGHRAALDFRRERNGGASRTLEVWRVVMIHPYWDMAILAVDGLDGGAPPLRLSLKDISELDGHEIAVVGYPAFDPRNDASEQDTLFDSAYGVKRLQPGQLHRRAETESFGKLVFAAAHDCSTLGGNSGSAIIDLETGEVVALHFGGRYHERNFAVPAFELGRDGRVVDAGVTFAGRPAGGTPPWGEWWEVDEAPADGGDGGGAPAPDTQPPRANAVATRRTGADGAVTIEIPLHITVRLGSPAAPATGTGAPGTEAAAGAEMLEALVEPWRDENYRSRRGYKEDFLGVTVPMPEAADPAVLARTRSGSTELQYQNFSIVMHEARRLALITASNVTAEKKLRRPDPRKKYTRAALSGLGENDQERWFLDPRLDAKSQLPDAFFTKDRKAFDKGHIVRRDDVAWGETYDLLRRANGDTYHVTNCSPQTAAFNRSVGGEDNWGDLENHVLASASKERLTLFAGPVLDPADAVFVGVGDQGRQIRAKIPSRYWKVVVAPVQEGIAAFGFVLEQDLSDVAFEYVPAEEFVPHMYPLADIQEMAGVRFSKTLLDADQYETVRGAEVSINAGARRKRRKR